MHPHRHKPHHSTAATDLVGLQMYFVQSTTKDLGRYLCTLLSERRGRSLPRIAGAGAKETSLVRALYHVNLYHNAANLGTNLGASRLCGTYNFLCPRPGSSSLSSPSSTTRKLNPSNSLWHSHLPMDALEGKLEERPSSVDLTICPACTAGARGADKNISDGTCLSVSACSRCCRDRT